MDKQKQIEEMAKEFEDINVYQDNECCKCKKYEYAECEYECFAKKSAEYFYNLGYRKIPETALVLTREEYAQVHGTVKVHGELLKDLQEAKSIFEEEVEEARKEFVKQLEENEKEIRKETAETIIKEIDKELYETSRMYLEAVVKDSKDYNSMDKYGVMTIAHDIVVRVAKQFGIEMEGNL